MAFRLPISLVIFFSILIFYCFPSSEAQKVPAIFIFGDSTVDVGNNNYLKNSARADFPHNGIDYPGGIPTGRFSNGKNAADILAETMCLASPPPYLSIATVNDRGNVSMAGVNFASGGAGVLNDISPSVCTISSEIS